MGINVRNQVSAGAWEQGLGTFFYEGVPFSFSTGEAFASVIATLIQGLYADRNRVCVEELGAGLGMLSVHVLQVLARHSPELFAKTKLHVTEFSAALAKALADTGVFAAFQDRVTLGQEDCRQFSGHSPDLMVMAYVFDAIPARQLVFQEGQWWERHVSLALPDRLLWDCRFFPPEPISARDLFVEFEKTDVFPLLRQVWPDVVETERLRPLNWEDIPDADREALLALSDANPTHCLRLNYPVALSQILDGLWQRLSEAGVLLIYDVGGLTTSCTPAWEDLQTTYGVTLCSMVPFSLIQAWASRRGVCSRYTDHPEGNSQVMLLSHQPISETLWSRFVGLSEVSSYGAYAQAIRAIHAKTADFWHAVNLSDISEKGLSLLSMMPALSSDYTLCMHVSERCYTAGAYGQAQAFLAPLLRDYGAVGASAWLLQGKILKAMSETEAAREAFVRGHQIAPHDEYLLYELAALSLSQRAYAAYIGYAKAYLRYRCHLPDIWETTVTVLLCMALLGQRDAVQTACEALQKLSQKGFLPEGIMQKVHGIQRGMGS